MSHNVDRRRQGGGHHRSDVAQQTRQRPPFPPPSSSSADDDDDDHHHNDGSNNDEANGEGGGGNGNHPLTDLAELEQLLDEAERMKGLGNKHMANQEYTKAYNAYSAAVQLSPSGPNSHVFLSNRAAALLSLKRYSAAADDARRAASLQPTFGKAHARLGQSLYFLKDYEGAVEAYEEAVKYDFDNAVTWTYLAKAKAKLVKIRTREAQASSREKLERLERDVMKEEEGSSKDGKINGGGELPSAENILQSLQIQEKEGKKPHSQQQRNNNGDGKEWQDEYKVNRGPSNATTNDNNPSNARRTSPFQRTSPRQNMKLRGAPSRDYSESGEEEKRPIGDVDGGEEEPSISGISPSNSRSFDSRGGRQQQRGGVGISPSYSKSFESQDEGSEESPRRGIRPPTFEQEEDGHDGLGGAGARANSLESLGSSESHNQRPGLGSRSTSVNDAIDELAEEFAQQNDEVPVGRGHLILEEMRAAKARRRDDRKGEQPHEQGEEVDEGDYRRGHEEEEDREAARREMMRSASVEDDDDDGGEGDENDQDEDDDYYDSDEDDGEPYVVTRSQQERGHPPQQQQQRHHPPRQRETQAPPQSQYDGPPQQPPPPERSNERGGGPVDLDDSIEEGEEREEEGRPSEDEIDDLFRRGNHHLGRKEFNMAIDEYTSALDLLGLGGDDDYDGYDWDALLDDEILSDVSYKIFINRANAYNNLRMHSEASRDARRAVEIRPDDHVGYSVLGKSLFYLRDYEGTLTALTESFALNQDDNGPSIFDRAYFDKAKEALGRKTVGDGATTANNDRAIASNNGSPSRGQRGGRPPGGAGAAAGSSSKNSSPTRPSRGSTAGDTATSNSSPARSNASASTASSSSTGLITPKNANKPVPRLRPPRFVSREEALSSTPSLPPMPSRWPRQSLADGNGDGVKVVDDNTFRVGPERDVTFWDGPMGIKLNRGTDGIVRIISTSASTAGGTGVARREGKIDVGDVVREAAGVDLRRPITNVMWGDTVALIKMTPRPVVLVVARELSRPPPGAAEELARAAAEDMEAAMLRPPGGGDVSGGGGARKSGTGRSVLPSPAIGEESVEDFVNGATEAEREEPEGQGEVPEQGDSPGAASAADPNEVGSSTSSTPGAQDPEKTVTLEDDDDGLDDKEEDAAVVPDVDDSAAEGGAAFAGGSEASDRDGDGAHGDDDGEVEVETSDEVSASVHEVPPEGDSAHGGTAAGDEEDGDGAAGIGTDTTSPTTSSSSPEKAPPPPPCDTAVEESSPPSTPEAKKTTDKRGEAPLTPRQREIRSLRGEILFEAPNKAQDAPDPGTGGVGVTTTWSNNRWLSTSDTRVLRHCGMVTRVTFPRGRLSALFGGAGRENYESRMLALFHDPDLILLLRRPRNEGEVRRLLILPKNVEIDSGSSSVVDSFWVAEHVIDPKMCKIRLSNLTTPTSVYVGPNNDRGGGSSSSSSPSVAAGGRGGNGNGGNFPSSPNGDGGGVNNRFRSCFELITPSESFLLSAVQLRPPSSPGGVATPPDDHENDSFLEMNCWEVALSNSILSAHNPHGLFTEPNIDGDDRCQAWRHQVVLGTLHSHVVVGNDTILRRVLEGPSDGVDVDAVDECGRTALHYACARRSNVAVRLLVGTGGADPSVPTTTRRSGGAGGPGAGAGMTPCHISAEHLDERSLSIILSASSSGGRRPDPNALDGRGRTPMHVAAVDGRAVGGSRDPRALALCLSALEAWGGRLTVSPDELPERESDDPTGMLADVLRKLDHPVFVLSSQWRADDLDVVLRQCDNERNANSSEDSSSPGVGSSEVMSMSLGASFNYPIHAALLSLRRRVMLIREKHSYPTAGAGVGKVAVVKSGHPTSGLFQTSPLVRTLRVLLDHGMEPNERCECLSASGSGRGGSSMIARAECDSVVGFTPLQILATTAMEATAMLAQKDVPREDDDEQQRQRKLEEEKVRELTKMVDEHRIMQDVADAAECLVMSGARLNVSPPPMLRHKQKSLSSLSVDSCGSENDVAPEVSAGFPPVDRSTLTIEGNDEMLEAMGGAERLNAARTSWSTLTPRTTPCGKRIHLLERKPSSIEDYSDVPGGSDERTCAVCWRPFGMVMNRRHVCRATRRYVCEECSTKRVVKDNEEFRVSDGQFLLGRAEDVSARARMKEEKEERSITFSVQAPKTKMHQRQRETATSQRSEKEELFGSVGKSVMNFITGGEEDEEEDIGSSLGGLTTSLGRAKDSLNERGEKLSTLSDKTAALADASKDFASMAKSLNESQQGGFFW